MWWKVASEIVLVIAVLFLGNFWACVKSRPHLRGVLNDTKELQKFIEFIGREKIVAASRSIKPLFGSYDANIAALEKVHFSSLIKARNVMSLGVFVVLALSYLLGIYYLITNMVIFMLLSAAPLGPSAENNNFAHLQGVILNVYAWNIANRADCSDYCTRKNPSLKHVYELVARL